MWSVQVLKTLLFNPCFCRFPTPLQTGALGRLPAHFFYSKVSALFNGCARERRGVLWCGERWGVLWRGERWGVLWCGER
jgi:hypothetical protein